jgi:hypothetical protein
MLQHLQAALPALAGRPWLDYLAWFVGGAALINAIPHLVAGLMGRPFQSPFAKPPGQGLSSSRTNVLWGFVNLILAYLLLTHVGRFDFQSGVDMEIAGLGGLLIGLFCAGHFGRFNGGNGAEKSSS